LESNGDGQTEKNEFLANPSRPNNLAATQKGAFFTNPYKSVGGGAKESWTGQKGGTSQPVFNTTDQKQPSFRNFLLRPNDLNSLNKVHPIRREHFIQ
jgi:hypothetical protein